MDLGEAVPVLCTSTAISRPESGPRDLKIGTYCKVPRNWRVLKSPLNKYLSSLIRR